jgi:hypothetical protein
MVRQFPDDLGRRVELARALCEFALTLSDRFRQGDLGEASACLLRALAVDEHIPASAETTWPRCG